MIFCISSRISAVLRAPLAITQSVEPRHREIARVVRERRVRLPGLTISGSVAPRFTTEYDEIEQRVRAEAIRAVH
jgi:hypothetical protein